MTGETTTARAALVPFCRECGDAGHLPSVHYELDRLAAPTRERMLTLIAGAYRAGHWHARDSFDGPTYVEMRAELSIYTGDEILVARVALDSTYAKTFHRAALRVA